MRRPLGVGLALAALLSLAAACQEERERPPYQVDDGTSSVPPPGSGGGGTGDADGGDGQEGGDGETDGGACHDLPNTGPVIDQLGVVGEPPVGNGGPITEGVYDLTDAQVYGASGGGPTDVSFRGSIEVITLTAEIDSVLVRQQTIGPDLERRVTFQYTVGGSTLVTQQSCPPGGQEQHSYTATDTTLVITNLVTRESFTFTRR